MSISICILNANYWEHYKFAKELALIYPINHPKRIEIEKILNDLQSKINNDIHHPTR